MIIREYESELMEISPKSRKISTSVARVLFDTKKKYQFKNKTNHKKSVIFSGFKVAEYVNGVEQLKHNKKRTRNRKYVG